jgi:transposase
MKYFVGLDVSLKETAICLVDADGIIIAEGKTLSEPDAIAAWLTERDVPISRVGMEIGGPVAMALQSS